MKRAPTKSVFVTIIGSSVAVGTAATAASIAVLVLKLVF